MHRDDISLTTSHKVKVHEAYERERYRELGVDTCKTYETRNLHFLLLFSYLLYKLLFSFILIRTSSFQCRC